MDEGRKVAPQPKCSVYKQRCAGTSYECRSENLTCRLIRSLRRRNLKVKDLAYEDEVLRTLQGHSSIAVRDTREVEGMPRCSQCAAGPPFSFYASLDTTFH